MVIPISIETGQSVKNLEELKNNVNSLFEDITQNSMIPQDSMTSLINGIQPLSPELTQQDTAITRLNVINNLFETLQQELQKNTESLKKLRETSSVENTNTTSLTTTAGTLQQESNKPEKKNEEIQSAKDFISATQNLTNIGKTAVSGDVWNASISAGSSISNSLIEKGKKDNGSLSFLGKAGIAGVIASLLAGVANSASQQYEEALPGISALNTAFGGENIHTYSREMNALQGLHLRSKVVESAKETGLSTDVFGSHMSTLSRYGLTDVDRAALLTNTASGWSNYTGIDINNATNFMGLIEKFGGDSRDAMRYAYNTARNSGLEKNQFPEFLAGLQKVMEEGIAKGFVRSTENIADNFQILASLGNDKIWQGEEGIRRYSQMAAGLSNMTGLNSTSSLLANRVMSTLLGENDVNAKELLGEGNYIRSGSVFNELALMEKGDFSGNFIPELTKTINAAFGSDIDSKIATYKEMFGLNWTGAIQTYNVLHDNNLSQQEKEEKIEEIKADPTVKNDQTKMQDTLNSINDNIVKASKPFFDIKFSAIDGIATGVDKIYNLVAGNSYKSLLDPLLDPLYEEHEAGFKQETFDLLYKDLVNPNEEIRNNAIKTVETLSKLDEEQRAYVDLHNLLNDEDGYILPDSIGRSQYHKIKDSSITVGSGVNQQTETISSIVRMLEGASEEAGFEVDLLGALKKAIDKDVSPDKIGSALKEWMSGQQRPDITGTVVTSDRRAIENLLESVVKQLEILNQKIEY